MESTLKNLKIIHVVPGCEQDEQSMPFVRRQIQSLKQQGLDCRIFFLESRTNPFKILSEAIRLRRMRKEYEPALVHAHFGTFTSIFVTVLIGNKTVITYRGSDLNPVPSMHRIHALLGHAMSHISSLFASKIICVSAELKSRLIRFVQKKVSIVPNGVSLEKFAIIERTSARQILNLDSMESIILFNAGLNPRVKRLDIAKAIFQKVKIKTQNVKLIILDGKIKPTLIPTYMAAADILLVTSDYEGSPNIVKEAMACNLAVATFPVGDVTELLEEVYPSYISNCIETLTYMITNHLQNPIRSNGRDIAQLKFSEVITAQKILNIYRSALC